jgi:glycine dehydrogenase
VGIALDETTTQADVDALTAVFAEACGKRAPAAAVAVAAAPKAASLIAGSAYARTSAYLTADVFNMYHAEHEARCRAVLQPVLTR